MEFFVAAGVDHFGITQDVLLEETEGEDMFDVCDDFPVGGMKDDLFA